jgi:probable HAF family extracellular repeat protein
VNYWRALPVLFVTPIAAAPIYSVINLGGAASAAFAIGPSGVAVGAIQTAELGSRPAVMSGGVPQAVGSHAGQAAGINAAGAIVGTARTVSGNRAAIWSGADTELLPTLGGAEAFGLAINGLGDVVGSSATSSGAEEAFFYSSGTLSALGTLGGAWSAAYAINDSRQVVGYSKTASGTFGAFLWDSHSGLRPLPGLDGRHSYAFAINTTGAVVGSAMTRSGYLHAYLYEGGLTRDLGTLGGDLSAAYGINSSNYVVGYSFDRRGRQRAFLWRAGVLYDLNALVGDSDWTFEAAYGINDAGQIVGSGTYRGYTAAFRLDPVEQPAAFDPARFEYATTRIAADAAQVPEPGTAIFVMTAAGLLWAWKNRRKPQ